MSTLSIIKLKLGQAIDATKNFLFDASAQDGGLVLKRESGQELMLISTAGKVSFPRNAQTWQDVTATRLASTTYTNTTGLSIQVVITTNSLGPEGRTLTVGSVSFSRNIANTANASVSFDIIIPAGATYSYNGSFSSWHELRN